MDDSKKILEGIKNHKDLRDLNYNQLGKLSEEVRELIINVVASSGGHLAPNLGIVELTVALLRTFDPPEDKIVWDVGHQCYPYKILTDRREDFPTIRQYGGISGFPKRCESEFDAFGVGHASTSISAALGMAAARDIKEDDNKVVAVIGDGALTGGVAFEGLNNAGAEDKDLLIILNDNSMSISPNVGALSKYLTKILTNPTFARVKSEVWELTGKLRRFGGHIRKFVRNLEESLKNLLVPGLFFEELGFKYYGPIDGHDIRELEEVLEDIKDLQFPKLLHITTQKGRGYSPAEKNKPKFHGIGSFIKATGETEGGSQKRRRYCKVFGETMVDMANKDDKLITITAAMALGTGLENFSEQYPDRFFDVGIEEEHAVIFGTSAALEGLNAVVSLYSTFLQRGFDQLIHDAALQEAPVVFAVDRAGLVGADGPTHHGAFDLSYLRVIPDIVVAAPKDENELRNLLHTAINWEEGPFAVRYPRAPIRGVEMSAGYEEIEVGTWEVLEEGAQEIAIIATGSMVKNASNALEILDDEGISPALINGRFIKPLDNEMLATIEDKYEKIISVEENAVEGGFGSTIKENLSDGANDFRALGIPDRFVTHGKREILLEKIGLHPEGIAQEVKKFLRDEV